MGGDIDGQQHQQGFGWLLDDAGLLLEPVFSFSYFSFSLWEEKEEDFSLDGGHRKAWHYLESFPTALILSDRS